MDQTDTIPQPEVVAPETTVESTPMSNMPPEYTILVERLTGTVKWFNNRAGFGFITVCEPGEYENKEIFVHWSSIRVSNSQYKYLFQGEYVDFTLVKANNNDHEYQAMNVSGVRGGPIMCETRRSNGPSTDHPPRFHQPIRNGPPRRERADRGGDRADRADDSDRRDQDRPSRRPRTRPAGGQSDPSKNVDLLDYVKVQSKRNRRTNTTAAR